MWQELFQGATLLNLPLVVMIGFIAMFLGVLVWVFSRQRAPHFDKMAALPLDDSMPGAWRQENLDD